MFAQAVGAIVQHAAQHGPRFVIEEYCDGPEVNVNLVLSNGELLFAEVCDEPPKRGDGLPAGNVVSFIELDTFYPSRLPSPELNMLVRDLHHTLLQLGLHSGVFHLEARVKYSEMAYVHRNRLQKLEYAQPSSGEEGGSPPSTWLIEINARPPGIAASESVQGAYGIDYVGLGLLFTLQDYKRIKALSHPFIRGPQYWCQTVFIPVEQGGVFDSDDICDDLSKRRPDLAQQISSSACLWRRGEVVPPPNYAAWIAYFVIFSRVGHRDLQSISETIRREVRYSIV